MKKFSLFILAVAIGFSCNAQNIITITPDNAYQGDNASVSIMSQTPFSSGTSTGTPTVYLEQGTSTFILGSNTVLAGSNTITSDFDIYSNADTGYYDLRIFANSTYFLPNAFFVNANLNGNGNLGGTVYSGSPKTGSLTVTGLKLTLLTPFNNVRLITKTDANGQYQFLHLPDGTYTINAEGADNSQAPSYTIGGSNTNLTAKDLYIDNNVLVSGIKDVVLDETLFTLTPTVFNNTVKMGYSLSTTANVEVNVYDMAGKLLLNKNLGKQSAGKYAYDLNMEAVRSTGVYLFVIKANGQSFVKKAIKGN